MCCKNEEQVDKTDKPSSDSKISFCQCILPVAGIDVAGYLFYTTQKHSEEPVKTENTFKD